ncbi:FtsX-like permease family protein [Prolixibacteraceae bacterium JC049]|nr:FtsX-like permease family protein [Prolixibacteraceae bacterium JC049]
MSKPKKQIIRRRLINAYVVSGISVSLVLFLLGCFGLLVINAKQLSNYVRENVGFTLILDDQAKEAEIIHLQRTLKATGYAKSTRYVDKENAAKELRKDLGEDFVGFLGYNPLLASIDVKLKSEYMHPDSLTILEQEFLENQVVNEVYYQRDLVALINENINKISFILLGASFVLLLISVALINNTIRLMVYADRFLIHTMQLVGATRSFIRKPFLLRTIMVGIIGALLANIGVGALVVNYQDELRNIMDIARIEELAILFGFIVLCGVVISWISTHLAVGRYLRSSFDELF